MAKKEVLLLLLPLLAPAVESGGSYQQSHAACLRCFLSEIGDSAWNSFLAATCTG